MLLDYSYGQFKFYCEYEERNIPKQARFFWDSKNKQWVTASARCAARLMEYANQSAKRVILDKLAKRPSYQKPEKRIKTSRGYKYNI